jgi:hypothetical protein
MNTSCVRCGKENLGTGQWCRDCADYAPTGKNWDETYSLLAICLGKEGDCTMYRPIVVLRSAFHAMDTDRFVLKPCILRFDDREFRDIAEKDDREFRGIAEKDELVEISWLEEGGIAHVRRLGGKP